MAEPICVRSFEKIARVWLAKREAEVAIRIQYTVEDRNGCMVYQICQLEHFD